MGVRFDAGVGAARVLLLCLNVLFAGACTRPEPAPAPEAHSATPERSAPDPAAALVVLTEAGDVSALDRGAKVALRLGQESSSGSLACAAAVKAAVLVSDQAIVRYDLSKRSSERFPLPPLPICPGPGLAGCAVRTLSVEPDATGVCIEVTDGPPSTASQSLSMRIPLGGAAPTVVAGCGVQMNSPLEGCALPTERGPLALRPDGSCDAASINTSASGRHVAVEVREECHDYCYRSVLLVDRRERALRMQLPGIEALEAVTWEPGGERLLVGGWLLDPAAKSPAALGVAACWLAQ